MKINLIAIGKKMPSWVNEGFNEYAQRLPHEFKINLIELPAQKRTKHADVGQLLLREGEDLLSAIPVGNHVIALERTGKATNTQQMAKKLESLHHQSIDVSLLIGGPEGISNTCLKKADTLWSLSELTLPHPLVRVLIAEQIYRSWSIMTHHPYHR